MFEFLIKLFDRKNTNVPEKIESFTFLPEPFDPKTAVTPGALKENIYEYFIFCNDSNAADDKHFLYYRRIFSQENTLADAERTLSHIKSAYVHQIVKFNLVTNCAVDVHPSLEELINAKILEYKAEKNNPANLEALMDFVAGLKPTPTL